MRGMPQIATSDGFPSWFPPGLWLQVLLYFRMARMPLSLRNFKVDTRAFFPCRPYLLVGVLSFKSTDFSRRGISPTSRALDFPR